MSSPSDEVLERLSEIRQNIAEAAAEAGRSTDAVRLMAVTKTVPPEIVNVAIGAGVDLLGENRVQEYLSKKDFYTPPYELHFIGHLQTNKVRQIVGKVDMIESVDSVKLANEINRVSAKQDIVTKVLLEVNIGCQESKTGVLPEGLPELLKTAAALPNIKVEGLMAIPPQENVLYYFAKMQQLFIDISEKKVDNVDMHTLSMGMSHDYKQAVKYGATQVRIGTALFGGRK